MTSRAISIPSGNTHLIEFNTTYSQQWSVQGKRGNNVLSGEVTAARFMLKKNISLPDNQSSITKNLNAGIAATDGKLTVTLDAADTKDLQGTYYATLRITIGTSVVDWRDSQYSDSPSIQVTFTQGAVESIS